ncbi:serine/threonine-protein kinase [Nocardia huaxiensis]|nr:serine/threonine-protein kinase [Nocardia huaxiensis]
MQPTRNGQFAGYRLETLLGRGGMGSVYLAADPRLPRQVAIKVLNQEIATDPDLRSRFDREAMVIARLDHPNIVGIHDRGVQDGHLWIAMQYIHGTDAARLDPRTVAVDRALRIVTETAAALDFAHGRGILHRDVKPANILLSAPEPGRAERAVLTDFGIARLADANTQLTSTGAFAATLGFASPEQLSGEPIDHRSDQYSLACTLFAILTGQPPFSATNPGQVVAAHLSKPVPRLSAHRPDAPAALDAVIAKAMAKDRAHRFASCTEFATAAHAAATARRIPAAAAPVGAAPVGAAAENSPTRLADSVPRNPVPMPAPGTAVLPGPTGPGAPAAVRAASPAGPVAAVMTPGPRWQTSRRRGWKGPFSAICMAFACAVFSVAGALGLRMFPGKALGGSERVELMPETAAPYLLWTTVCAGLVVGLLAVGAVLLVSAPRIGRVLVVLGSLGFIAGVAVTQLQAHFSGNENTRIFFAPLLNPWVIGAGSLGIVLAIGALVCAVSVRP